MLVRCALPLQGLLPFCESLVLKDSFKRQATEDDPSSPLMANYPPRKSLVSGSIPNPRFSAESGSLSKPSSSASSGLKMPLKPALKKANSTQNLPKPTVGPPPDSAIPASTDGAVDDETKEMWTYAQRYRSQSDPHTNPGPASNGPRVRLEDSRTKSGPGMDRDAGATARSTVGPPTRTPTNITSLPLLSPSPSQQEGRTGARSSSASGAEAPTSR